jgi:hypothetical protein
MAIALTNVSFDGSPVQFRMVPALQRPGGFGSAGKADRFLIAQDQGLIQIRKRDKWLAWAKHPLTNVPNAHVLIAIAQAHLSSYRQTA